MDFKASEIRAGSWTVHIAPNELVVDSGKPYPHGTCIGTVGPDGRLSAWTPVGYKPRGFKAAALRMLDEAREQLRERGDLRGLLPRVWHAIVNASGHYVIEAYREDHLSWAQERAARMQRATPEHEIRVEQIRQRRQPINGDFFKGPVQS